MNRQDIEADVVYLRPRCRHHDCDLDLVGMETELLIYADPKKDGEFVTQAKGYVTDLSGFSCPGLVDEDDDEELEACQDSWYYVVTLESW